MKYVAFSRNPVRLPFHCGFQPEGKPYADYVAHLSNCRDRDCIARYERRDAVRMYFLRKYAMLKSDATASRFPSSAGTRVPVAQSKTGQRA